MIVKLLAADGITQVGTITVPYVSHEDPPPYLRVPIPVAPTRYFRHETGDRYCEITDEMYFVDDVIETAEGQ